VGLEVGAVSEREWGGEIGVRAVGVLAEWGIFGESWEEGLFTFKSFLAKE
tara:strand:- start:1931 stop:2080 length:150 start_codon:yes stop_codon:yes gene_type:complete